MVIRYGYLWRDEQRRGLFEGRKDRPAAIILAHDDPKSGAKIVVVLPSGLYEQAKNLFFTLRQQGRIKLADRDQE